MIGQQSKILLILELPSEPAKALSLCQGAKCIVMAIRGDTKDDSARYQAGEDEVRSTD